MPFSVRSPGCRIPRTPRRAPHLFDGSAHIGDLNNRLRESPRRHRRGRVESAAHRSVDDRGLEQVRSTLHDAMTARIHLCVSIEEADT